MVGIRTACAAALMFVSAQSLHAEGCLQRFSCKLYGECRLPCFDDISVPAPTVLPSTVQPSSSSPSLEQPSTEGRSTTISMSQPVIVTKLQSTIKPSKRVAAPLNDHAEPRLRGDHRSFGSVKIVAGLQTLKLTQLAGKPVSLGPKGSPGEAIGRKIFGQLGIPIDETPLSFENAVDGIASGDIAAVLLVGPRNIEKVAALRSASLHLLSVPSGVPMSQVKLERK